MLKRLHSPDVQNLESWSPGDEPFGFLLQAMIGPIDSSDEDSFDITVCTPEWFAAKMMSGQSVISGIHTLFVTSYDYHALKAYLQRAAQRHEEKTWPEIAVRLSWLGHWEFAELHDDFEKIVDGDVASRASTSAATAFSSAAFINPSRFSSY